MNRKTWITAGIIAGAVGALYYPSLKLYQYIAKRRAQANENENKTGEDHTMKAFTPAYRGKRKLHRRHASNGIA